jgi:EAL domain-containing protein (putative c-di-GMP-specific phosphodiesterase class I)/ActR/RegA family two-component response regulator
VARLRRANLFGTRDGEPPSESAPPKTFSRAVPQAHVLIVDDDELLREACAGSLRVVGYEVTAVGSAEAALDEIARRRFDTICTDVSMPEVDGIGLIECIRAQDSDVPILVMTGSPTVSTAARAVELGASDYLVKPIGAARFADRVARTIRYGRIAQAKRESLKGNDDACRSGDDPQPSLQAALGSMWMAYQPIVEEGGALLGYEALVRSRTPALTTARALLSAAGAAQQGASLGQKARALVAQAAQAKPTPGKLFVNLSSDELFAEDLDRADAAIASIAKQTVVEIGEQSHFGDVGRVRDRAALLRSLGYEISIDDLGGGPPRQSVLAALQPEYAKFDMSLVRQADASATQRRVMHGIASVCRDLGMRVVAKGVETERELDAALESGCDLFQGFLIACPDAAFPIPRWPR